MNKNERWNILLNKINNYLINIVENLTFNITYNTWNEYDYDDSEGQYLELVEDISTIIGEILYNNESEIIVKDMSCVYVLSPDRCTSHLVAWKYTNELNTILIRFGAFGNVCYMKILI